MHVFSQRRAKHQGYINFSSIRLIGLFMNRRRFFIMALKEKKMSITSVSSIPAAVLFVMWVHVQWAIERSTDYTLIVSNF